MAQPQHGIGAHVNAGRDQDRQSGLGNPDVFTFRELSVKIIEQTASKSKFVQAPLPEDDPTRRRPDISLAKQRLDWQPKVKLAEGLQKTIEWFRGLDYSRYRAPTPNF